MSGDNHCIDHAGKSTASHTRGRSRGFAPAHDEKKAEKVVSPVDERDVIFND